MLDSAVLIPIALAAVALGWLAERLGWSRWVGISVALVASVACLAWWLVRRHAKR